MKVFDVLRRQLHNSDAAAQSLREIVAGLAGQSRMLDDRLERISALLAARTGGVGLATPPASARLPADGEERAVRSAGIHAAPARTPLAEIPYSRIDLAGLSNPVPALVDSEEFAATVRYLREHPGGGRSLVSEEGRALLGTLVRNQRPCHAVEIGTFHGGTTEVMARAMLANGGGTLHTVGPFDAEAFIPVYNGWPSELQQVVRFYPIDSMAFFMEMEARAIRPDLVFIDGNHDYEFALFDLMCAARRLQPGGFIILDDADQAGPYFAAQDFLVRHPDWIDCASSDRPPRDGTRAFDPDRTHISGTNFVVLRSPAHYRLVNERPFTFGEIPWPRPEARGLNLSLDGRQGPGVLHLQCILRGFGDGPQAQLVEGGTMAIAPGMHEAAVALSRPVVIADPVARCTLESWLIWAGEAPLRLETLPTPF